MNFKEAVQNLVTPDGLSMRITEEQKAALMAVQNAGNAEIYEKLPTTISSLTIARSIEMATTGVSENNVELFANKISLNTPDGIVNIPCATAKATNVVTVDLKDAVVFKPNVVLQIHQVEAAVANAAIRDDQLMPFTPKATNVEDDIVKKMTIRDFNMSATVFPQDMHKATELNQAIQMFANIKGNMMGEFLESVAKRGMNDTVLLTIYRNANRKLAEDTFDAYWMETYPLYDEGKPEEVSAYLSAKKAFLSSLETIGSKYISNSSARLGIQLRKVSISPNTKWTSTSKVGNVKSFGPQKSYYVSSNIDTGIMTVPTNTNILSAHIKDIITLTQYSAALIEEEARLQNGIATTVEKPDITGIKSTANYQGRKYHDILGISADQEQAVIEDLSSKLQDKAKNVVSAMKDRAAQDSADKLNALLGNGNS